MSAVIECPDCPEGDVEVDADQGHCLTCGWWESYEEQVERRAAVVSAEIVEALVRQVRGIRWSSKNGDLILGPELGDAGCRAVAAFIAQHDREVAAAALREAADELASGAERFAEGHQSWLSARADAIQEGRDEACDRSGVCLARAHLDGCRSQMSRDELEDQEGRADG